MDGILNILKPPGMTSFDVVSWLRGVLKTKKIGHTGTLDPMATGVLPVCVGKATKAIEYMMDKDKLYRAELTLGSATDTQDSSGTVISCTEIISTDSEITEAILSFKGRYMQLPPMYSAIKVDGRKLYELAREGTEIERKPRELEIYSIDIIKIDRDSEVRVLLDVHCSKGTYIRTLCADIGDKLGCGGHMSFLLRKKAGAFGLESALTLEEINEMAASGQIGSIMAEADTVFEGFQAITLNAADEKKLLNGVRVVINGCPGLGSGYVRVYNESERFLALGELSGTEDRLELKSKKIF